ncbi:MFS transporter [Paenibacillus sp. P96]|uniref:MFS transporter n=1 Tax=Paenibacillus zeirhizosphaerae TaxID=2987519 RepID=A0ABT9FTI1_9BACL|nr:MFS transporter [Paenibacillus sp. P96]MDP4097796.1 MFS transporter [Paenibacillus sp. P96]
MKRNGVIYLLAFGLFIMATAEIVVAGILGMIAEDLRVPVGMAGQLVTVFAVMIAVGSPVLLSLTSKMERKSVLILSSLVFLIGDLLAFFSPNFAVLMASRMVQAASTGVFTAVALTVGSSLAAPEKRGSAIGTMMMGASTALVVGVPLGTLIGEYWGWRDVFLLNFVLALLFTIGLAIFVPTSESRESVSLKTQLATLSDRRILSGLFITLFWTMGYQLLFTYIAPFLQESASLHASQISLILFICGIFAVIGSRIGGYGADRWGIYRTLSASLLLHAVALMVLPWGAVSFAGAFIILAVWIGSAYMTAPAQQYYLVSISPGTSGLVLGLNNSFTQLGIAIGAASGGWAVTQTSVKNLGWIGAMIILIGMLVAAYSFSLNKKLKVTS